MLVDFFLVFADTMDTPMDTFQFLAVRTNSSTGSTLMFTLVFHHPELQASTNKNIPIHLTVAKWTIWKIQIGNNENPISNLNLNMFINLLQPSRLMSLWPHRPGKASASPPRQAKGNFSQGLLKRIWGILTSKWQQIRCWIWKNDKNHPRFWTLGIQPPKRRLVMEAKLMMAFWRWWRPHPKSSFLRIWLDA